MLTVPRIQAVRFCIDLSANQVHNRYQYYPWLGEIKGKSGPMPSRIGICTS